jgi:hypothetical protein
MQEIFAAPLKSIFNSSERLEILDALFIPIVWKSPQNLINISLNMGVNRNVDYFASAASRRFYPTIFISIKRLSVTWKNYPPQLANLLMPTATLPE